MMARNVTLVLSALLIANCNGFVGGSSVEAPQGPSTAIIDADYVVLRELTETPVPGFASESNYGRTFYYDRAARIMDLRHLVPRSANVVGIPRGESAVFIDTTPDGDRLLGAWTADHLGKHLGIFLDGRLASAPVIQSKITGTIIIENDFAKGDAEKVVARVRRGGAAGPAVSP